MGGRPHDGTQPWGDVPTVKITNQTRPWGDVPTVKTKNQMQPWGDVPTVKTKEKQVHERHCYRLSFETPLLSFIHAQSLQSSILVINKLQCHKPFL